jgi:hypothetical protein
VGFDPIPRFIPEAEIPKAIATAASPVEAELIRLAALELPTAGQRPKIHRYQTEVPKPLAGVKPVTKKLTTYIYR